MFTSIRRDFSKAKLAKGDWPLLLILAFVSMHLVTLVLWASPLLFSNHENYAGVPASALSGQVVLFTLALLLALGLRIRRPHFPFWPLTSILITIYLVWLMVLRADLAFSLGSLVCIALLVWTNFSTQGRRTLNPGWGAPPQPPTWELAAGISLLAAALFIHVFFMGRFVLCRVWGLSTPTYDFGLFNQMFAYMKETGLPLTTLERDGLYSHFQVHFSPIYYLILPFYALFPKPETLQLAQILLVCSGLIPLLLLGRDFHLPWLLRAGLGAAYLLQPGLFLGSFYDLHENCFLAPLICWLFWAIFQGRFWASLAFGLLLLLVKEDAALYLVSAALFVFFSPLLSQHRYQVWPLVRKKPALQAETGTGKDEPISPTPSRAERSFSLSSSCFALLLAASGFLGFFLISSFLEQAGEGLMSYRFEILQQYGGTGFWGILRSLFQNPAQALGLIFGPDKLNYLITLALATGFLPFLQTARSHYLLFLPLLVMNLATDYNYQYDIFFQYNYGSHTFIIIALLLALAGLRDQATWPPGGKTQRKLLPASALPTLLLALAIFSAGYLSLYNLQTQAFYVAKYQEDPDYYQEIRQALEALPRDKVIGADTFSTTFLADCPQLYDLKFNDSAATGQRDLDLLVWAANHPGEKLSDNPWVAPVWDLYKSKGYMERPDLAANGLLRVLSKPELAPTKK